MKKQLSPIGAYYFLRPIMFIFSPEMMHSISLLLFRIIGSFIILQKITKLLFSPKLDNFYLFNIKFKNRIGIAAGYDKNGVAIKGLSALGIGHLEIGTITPQPQLGNKKPRIFRLKNKSGLINHMGFPNDGLEVIAKRIENFTFKL